MMSTRNDRNNHEDVDTLYERERKTGLERHVQSILLALITAGLIGLGSFVIVSREDAVRSSSKFDALTAEVAALRGQIALLQNNYVARDDFRDHESRLRTLEAQERADWGLTPRQR